MDKLMRNTIIVGIIISTLSISYFFVIFLPNKKANELKQQELSKGLDSIEKDQPIEQLDTNNQVEDIGVEPINENIEQNNQSSEGTNYSENENKKLEQEQKDLEKKKKKEDAKKQAELDDKINSEKNESQAIQAKINNEVECRKLYSANPECTISNKIFRTKSDFDSFIKEEEKIQIIVIDACKKKSGAASEDCESSNKIDFDKYNDKFKRCQEIIKQCD